MKALMLKNKVVQIAEETFPVSKSFSWVECDDAVKVGYKYEDEQFFDPNHIDYQERERKERIQELKNLLAKTDYMMLPDYKERTHMAEQELEQVKQDRLAWYEELKGII